jgi:hypothetical protein
MKSLRIEIMMKLLFYTTPHRALRPGQFFRIRRMEFRHPITHSVSERVDKPIGIVPGFVVDENATRAAGHPFWVLHAMNWG